MTILSFVSVLSAGVSIGYVIAGVTPNKCGVGDSMAAPRAEAARWHGNIYESREVLFDGLRAL